MMVFISTKFHENILDGIKAIERTRFPSEKIQRAIISQKNVGGVPVLVLCTSSGYGLYLNQIS